jgi:DNA helicase-2/ATP-dependent DNA helicase PcrA
MRTLANPRDQLHLAALFKRWALEPPDEVLTEPSQVIALLGKSADATPSPRSNAVYSAIKLLSDVGSHLKLKPAIDVLRAQADKFEEGEKAAIYDDTEVMLREWDQYLRGGSSKSHTLAGFLSSMALGTSQQLNSDGVALLTVHSSKGLEFEVVFLIGMAEGVFPDYRAQGRSTEMAEERRNAFVAVTRSRRLLYFSYPKRRMMPWGDVRVSKPSPFLGQISSLI